MEHKYKEFALLKSEGEAGTISGYFSTYDRIPDSYGDVIAKGAFTETIRKRKESGHPFPLCWNHDLNQIIGSVDPDDITDTDKGPLMTASFFNTPLAQEKREIVKSGVVYQFSFAYDILNAAEVMLGDGVKANELQEIELYEISIVPIPANQNAVATEIKSGRRNSAADASAIREAITLLQGVLGELEDIEEQQESDVKAEEPDTVNAEEQTKIADLLKEANDILTKGGQK